MKVLSVSAPSPLWEGDRARARSGGAVRVPGPHPSFATSLSLLASLSLPTEGEGALTESTGILEGSLLETFSSGRNSPSHAVVQSALPPLHGEGDRAPARSVGP